MKILIKIVILSVLFFDPLQVCSANIATQVEYGAAIATVPCAMMARYHDLKGNVRAADLAYVAAHASSLVNVVFRLNNNGLGKMGRDSAASSALALRNIARIIYHIRRVIGSRKAVAVSQDLLDTDHSQTPIDDFWDVTEISQTASKELSAQSDFFSFGHNDDVSEDFWGVIEKPQQAQKTVIKKVAEKKKPTAVLDDEKMLKASDMIDIFVLPLISGACSLGLAANVNPTGLSDTDKAKRSSFAAVQMLSVLAEEHRMLDAGDKRKKLIGALILASFAWLAVELKQVYAQPKPVETKPVEEDDDNDCPICLEAKNNSRLNCNHEFCFGCITAVYNSTNKLCPLCRAPIAMPPTRNK